MSQSVEMQCSSELCNYSVSSMTAARGIASWSFPSACPLCDNSLESMASTTDESDYPPEIVEFADEHGFDIEEVAERQGVAQ